jgi:hypothetical protein
MVPGAFWRSGCTYYGVCSGGRNGGDRAVRDRPSRGYNLSYFSNLGRCSASVKTGHFLRRHSKGENVKSFVPQPGANVAGVPQIGERQEKMGHLSN